MANDVMGEAGCWIARCSDGHGTPGQTMSTKDDGFFARVGKSGKKRHFGSTGWLKE